MKLTRAQRLFVAIGRLNSRILSESDFLKLLSMRVDEDEEPEANREHKHRLKQLLARRKKLIREALRAYELEIGDAFSAGHALMRCISEDAPMVIEEEGQTIIF